MSLAWKVTVTAILFVLAATAAVVLIVNLLGTPPTVDFTSASSGQPVNVTLQTVGTYGSGSHAPWVSYLVESPEGQWVHTTNFQVPEHVRINVTIVQYDSGSPLRNQQLGRVTGTSANAALLNGKLFQVINPTPATVWPTPSPCPRWASTFPCMATTETPTSAPRRPAPPSRRTK